jgi:hypothetical protein
VFNTKDFVMVAFVLVPSQFKEGLIGLGLVKLNLRLLSSHHIAAAIEREVNTLVGVLRVKHKLLAGV